VPKSELITVESFIIREPFIVKNERGSISILTELLIVTEPVTVRPRKNNILRLDAELPPEKVIDWQEPVALTTHVFPAGITTSSWSLGTPFGIQLEPLFQLLLFAAVKVLVCEKILHDINK
jgi:hypothetical protein